MRGASRPAADAAAMIREAPRPTRSGLQREVRRGEVVPEIVGKAALAVHERFEALVAEHRPERRLGVPALAIRDRASEEEEQRYAEEERDDERSLLGREGLLGVGNSHAARR